MIKIKCNSENPLGIEEKNASRSPYYLNLLLLKQVLNVTGFGMLNLFNEIKKNIRNEEKKDWYTISKERDALASDIVLKILSKSDQQTNQWGHISNTKIENLISINHEKYLLEALMNKYKESDIHDAEDIREIENFLARQKFESKFNESIMIKLISAVKCVIREYTKRVSCLNKSNIQIEYSNLPTRRWNEKDKPSENSRKMKWKNKDYLSKKLKLGVLPKNKRILLK
jgi:hypothetical protein